MGTLTRLDLLERGLYGVVAEAVGPSVSVSWAYGDTLAEDQGDRWVSLRLASGPLPELRPMGAGCALPNVVDLTLRVTAAAAGVYWIEVNGIRASYGATVADTVTTIRDALLAGLDPLLGAENTAAASGADSITITQSQAGSIRRVRRSAQIAVTGDTTSGSVMVSEVSAAVAVEISSFSTAGPSLANSAAVAMAAIEGIHRDAAALSSLAEVGIKPRGLSNPFDLSDFRSGAWQSRQVATLSLSIPAIEARASVLVSGLSLDLVVRDNAGVTLSTIQITE